MTSNNSGFIVVSSVHRRSPSRLHHFRAIVTTRCAQSLVVPQFRPLVGPHGNVAHTGQCVADKLQHRAHDSRSVAVTPHRRSSKTLGLRSWISVGYRKAKERETVEEFGKAD